MRKYILGLDEGTSGIKAALYDASLRQVGYAYRKLHLQTGPEGLAEQGPESIAALSVEAMREAVRVSGVAPSEVACLAIACQRASWMLWTDTGRPLTNLITWLDTRAKGSQETFAGSHLDAATGGRAISTTPYAIKRMIDQQPLAQAMQRTDVRWGNVDAWLLHWFAGAQAHKTSLSMACFSSLLNPKTLGWDETLLRHLHLTAPMMPEIVEETACFGMLHEGILGAEIPIVTIIGDQPAALYATAFDPGMIKCTIGTGTFVNAQVPAGHRSDRLLTSIAWKKQGRVVHMVEGNSFEAGVALNWAREQMPLHAPGHPQDTASDSNGVVFIPALDGMRGYPHYEPRVRSSFFGIDLHTRAAHMDRAVQDAVAFMAGQLIETVSREVPVQRIAISGGVCNDRSICQLLANITGKRLYRPRLINLSLRGAAQMAGEYVGLIAPGFITSETDEVEIISADGNRARDAHLYRRWNDALLGAYRWAEAQ